jgi:hypothetical protein
MKRSAWRVRADDLRRIAAKTAEPERERKMLVLAERLRRQSAPARPTATIRPPTPEGAGARVEG